jgi:hypothetical protein
MQVFKKLLILFNGNNYLFLLSFFINNITLTYALTGYEPRHNNSSLQAKLDYKKGGA